MFEAAKAPSTFRSPISVQTVQSLSVRFRSPWPVRSQFSIRNMAHNRSTKRHLRSRLEKAAGDEDEPLSKEWIREIKRRVRDAEDPIRYMIASEFSRRFVLYYNVSSDSFVMNSPEHGTQFKRREIAERVVQLLGKHHALVKFTTKNGKLRRLSPVRRKPG